MTIQDFIEGYNKLVQETGYQLVPISEVVKVGSVEVRLSQELRIAPVERTDTASIRHNPSVSSEGG